MSTPVPKVASSQAALGKMILQVIVEVLQTGQPQRLSVTDASGTTIFITIEQPEDAQSGAH